MKDFFISFNRADRAWAEWIAWQLEAAKYSVVFQDWDFVPGENFVAEMDGALKACRRMVAVLSPDYVASAFASAEWQAAFAADPQGRQRSLVPVRVREVELAGLLAQVIYVDLVGLADEGTARKRLLGGLGARLKPRLRPQFPGRRGPAFPGNLGETPGPPPGAVGEPFPGAHGPPSGDRDATVHRPGARRKPLAWALTGVVVPLVAAALGVPEFRAAVLSPFGDRAYSATTARLEKQTLDAVEVELTNLGNRPSAVAGGELRLVAGDVPEGCAVALPLRLQQPEQGLSVSPQGGRLVVRFTGETLRARDLCEAAGSSAAEWRTFVERAPWKLFVAVLEFPDRRADLEVPRAFAEDLSFPLWRYGWQPR